MQRGCSVVAYHAGGALVTAPRKNHCVVQIAEGKLVIEDAAGGVIDEAPVPAITITTPGVQRAVGGSTFVEMNDHRWSIDFGFAYQAERTGRTGTLGLMAGASLKGMKFGRKRNREFGVALVDAGAVAP
jgi:hypothetical protein